MHPLVRTAAVRRLDFANSSRAAGTLQTSPPLPDLETDPNFPKEWKIDGEDIDARIKKLKEDLISQGEPGVPTPVKDTNSKFRTEFRRILTAKNILTDALTLHNKEIEWAKSSAAMLSFDIDSLQNRKVEYERKVEQLKEKLARLDSSVGILKSTQLAVKSVIELREDEYMDDETDLSLTDEFQKFNKISKLCDTALKSYVVVKKRNEQLQKDLIVMRNKHRKHQDAMRDLMGEADRRRVDEGAKLFENFSLEQLRELSDQLKQVEANK